MKKRILVASNSSLLKTGFGRHVKCLLTELYKTNKYELCEYAHGDFRWNDGRLKKLPWRAHGVLPDDLSELNQFANNPALANLIHHGSYLISKVVEEFKPDVLIAVEDCWGVEDYYLNHSKIIAPFWNKIPCVLWTPLDSLPLFPGLIEHKDKIRNLWVKASFAKNELDRLGIESKLIPLLTDHNAFKPLNKESKDHLRKIFGLEDSFVIGFVFRNQLRKLVLTLMEGFKIFKDKYPESKAKLLLHTNFSEEHGWRIDRERKALGISSEDILTTYVCRNCKKIQIIPFAGQELNCLGCKTERSLINVTIDVGVTEDELNAIYNMADAYIHPCTSGGFESPMMEAMLAGIPTATCNYSFGETFVGSGYCLPLEFDFYRERDCHFKKSQPRVSSVVDVIEKLYKDPELRDKLGNGGREWALKEFEVGQYIKQIEEFVDNSTHNYDFNLRGLKNADYEPDYSLSDAEFVFDLARKMWRQTAVDTKYIDRLIAGELKENIYNEFKQISEQFNAENTPAKLEDFVKPSDKKKLIYIMPKSFGDCVISLTVLGELKKKYPLEEWDHYISTEPPYMEVFSHLDYIQNIIPFHPIMDDYRVLEGVGSNKGVFDIALQPYALTQRFISFHHNGLDT